MAPVSALKLLPVWTVQGVTSDCERLWLWREAVWAGVGAWPCSLTPRSHVEEREWEWDQRPQEQYKEEKMWHSSSRELLTKFISLLRNCRNSGVFLGNILLRISLPSYSTEEKCRGERELRIREIKC